MACAICIKPPSELTSRNVSSPCPNMCTNLIAETVSRDGVPDALVGYDALDPSWNILGMTPSSYTWGERETLGTLVYPS